MSKYKMDQCTLQSYFKSICNSFYIAYIQVKRLEKLEDELESICPEKELELVKNLLEISVPEELQQKYMASKYSKEELLEKRKEELELAKKEYDEKCKELQEPKWLWNELLWKTAGRSIALVLKQIKEEDFSVIVTSKEEIIALMAFFRGKSVKEYRIINTDEQYLKSFPTGEKMYEEFYAAYCLEDDKEMEKVIHKYF